MVNSIGKGDWALGMVAVANLPKVEGAELALISDTLGTSHIGIVRGRLHDASSDWCLATRW
ncbi:hypothetical protein PG997_012460 [Apiospora hydei]|uniref:Uncharacterized protein n=1 Tax=Apiospora hydei TaxID=1337664 RepID=A0ABR1V3F2_9PEZI